MNKHYAINNIATTSVLHKQTTSHNVIIYNPIEFLTHDCPLHKNLYFEIFFLLSSEI